MQRLLDVDPQEVVFLDTETTGLDGEIVEIACLSGTGKVLINTLVYPKGEIPAEASAVHHIDTSTYPEDHDPLLEWPVVLEKVRSIIAGKMVVAYNAIFDRKVMHITSESHDLAEETHKDLSTIAEWVCLMKAYREWSRGGPYLSLEEVSGVEAQTHRALEDCELARAVWLRMRSSVRPEPEPKLHVLVLRRSVPTRSGKRTIEVLGEIPFDAAIEHYLSVLSGSVPKEPPKTLRGLINYYREHPELNIEIAAPAPDTWKHVYSFVMRSKSS